MAKVEDQIKDGLSKAFSSIRGTDNTEKFKAMRTLKSQMAETDDEETKEEPKEATGAGSAGAFSGPLMTSPIKNTLFQPGTEAKHTTKPKGGFVKEENLEGGKADDKNLMDLAKKYTKDRYAKTQNKERIQKMYDHLTKQLNKGIKVEMEHTDSKKVAREIAMDHLAEDPNYYNKLAKIHNEAEKVEAKEATTSASAGAYSGPAFLAKNKKNWRGGAKPIYKGGAFVEVKKKCKTFPYCNQGDINALNIWESEMVQEGLKRASTKLGISEEIIKNLFETEVKKKSLNEQPEGQEPNYVEIIFKNDDSTKFDDLITDKKSKYLRSKFNKNKVEFSSKRLSGTIEIIDIGPADKGIGFMATPEDFNFDKGTDVQILYKLLELKFQGEKVPLGFYNYISQYIPEDDDDYSTDPVEDAILFGLDEINSVIKYLGLNLEKVNRNNY
jgi:hypothetical protein